MKNYNIFLYHWEITCSFKCMKQSVQIFACLDFCKNIDQGLEIIVGGNVGVNGVSQVTTQKNNKIWSGIYFMI